MLSVLRLLLQAVVKDYVELSFDQLPSIMEFLRGLLTQEGPVIVYTHCEVSGRREEGGGRGRGRGRVGERKKKGGWEERRGRGWKGGGGGEVGRKRRVKGSGPQCAVPPRSEEVKLRGEVRYYEGRYEVHTTM